jgi:membrane-bound lytic murein transglycosylase D
MRRFLVACCVVVLGGARSAAAAPPEPPPAPSVLATTPAAVPPAPRPAPEAPPAPETAADEPEVLPPLSPQEVDALVTRLIREAEAAARALHAPSTELEVAPDVMTSDAPASAATAAEESAEQSPDVAWLEGIALPDIPIRWHPALLEILTYYRDDPRGRAHIKTWIERSGRYETMIREKLAAAGAPRDLMYVAMVESGFDPTIVSPANAVGMWQFVETTGVDYGLEVTRFVDDRRNVDQATDAAAAYLKDLHGKLGSWPLALAAFNMGYGALLRSIRKYNTNDFWLLARLEAGLPYETTIYVAKIMACAIVAHNPERFGLADLRRDPAVEVGFVEVAGGLGLGRLATAAGMTAEALAALNPELLRKRIPPDVKTYELRVPADKLERMAKRWPEAQQDAPTHAVHVLRFGERLKDVAEMYGTREMKLRALNELSEGESVRPGTRLIVPDIEPAAPADPGEVVAGVPEQVFSYPDRRAVFYRVQNGDSVQSVADAFGVTVDELRLWNAISSEAAMHQGMLLQVFAPRGRDLSHTLYLPAEKVRTLVVGSAEFFDYHEAQRDRVRVRYRIKNGDSMSSLAERFDLSIGSIARINGFSTHKTLRPDDEIIVYVPTKDAVQLTSAAN